MKKNNSYGAYVKRLLDIVLSAFAIVVLSPLLLVLSILVRVKLGSPVVFRQPRPGKGERIFQLYKFRSMTNEIGEDGRLLPDSERLTKFGEFLRSSSLDERVIIGQTTKVLVNKGFCEVSPIHFLTGRDLLSTVDNYSFIAGGQRLLA